MTGERRVSITSPDVEEGQDPLCNHSFFTPSNDAIIAPFQGRDPWVWGQTSILGRVPWRNIKEGPRGIGWDWLWNGVKLVGWGWRMLADVDVDVDQARVMMSELMLTL